MNKYSLIFENEIKDKVLENAESFLSNLVTDEIIHEHDEANKEYLKACENYKKQHNQFAYVMLMIFGLFFSFILIIPFYWALKKFKQMKENKDDLLAKKEITIEAKLAIHRKLISRFDIVTCSNIIDKSLNVKNYGPITENVIESFKEIESFNFQDTPRYNPYKTSWSVFDDRLILINLYNKQHITQQKVYTGSRTIYYRVNGQTHSRIITAQIVKPVEVITTNEISYAYMQSCKELEMSFREKSYGNKLNLENEMMNKYTAWDFNNEVQFRMIFSLFGQEMYIKELEYINALKSIPYEYQFFKFKNFFYNNDNIDQTKMFFHSVYTFLSEFSKKPDCTIEWFEKNLRILMLKNTHERFQSIIYLWMVPILQSENHTHIINRIFAANKNNGTKNPISRHYPYYVLNEILNHSFIKSDTENINYINNFYDEQIGDINIRYVQFLAKGFDKYQKYESVSSSGYWIDIPYIDYVERTTFGDIGFSKVNESYYYNFDFNFGIESTNITDQATLDIIRKNWNDGNKVVIRNGIISWVPHSYNNQDEMIRLILNLRN